MKIAGTAVLNAPADRVWAALNDPSVLVRTIPGCEQLEAVSDDRFRMTIVAGVASIKGSYQGEVELADPSPPDAFTLRATGTGAPGTVSADVKIKLSSRDGVTTTVAYNADAVVGGAVGGVGQRVLTAVAKRTAGEFFAAVDAVLAEPSLAEPALAEPSRAEPVLAAIGKAAPAAGSGLRAVPPGSAPVPGPTVFTKPALPAAIGHPDQAQAALVGAGIALAGVLIGWLLGRRAS
jgi:uncharacterized protein